MRYTLVLRQSLVREMHSKLTPARVQGNSLQQVPEQVRGSNLVPAQKRKSALELVQNKKFVPELDKVLVREHIECVEVVGKQACKRFCERARVHI